MNLQPNKQDAIVLPITNTRISASEWNQLVGSCMAFITAAGLTPDAADNEQFLNAFKIIAANLELVGANTNLSNLTAKGEAHFDNKFSFKDLSNVPANILKDRIVASGFDGFGSYFFQYASGAIRQGGIIALSSGWQTITLFREMPNTNYIITTGAIIPDGDNPNVFIRSTNKTTTSFQAAFKWDIVQYKTGTLMWEAFTMGYTQGEE